MPLPALAAVFVLAAAAVWMAGTRLAARADAIAERTGLGSAAVGMVLLGCVTSLPEMAIAVTATLSGAPTLTISNVLGAASINVVILAVADAAYGRRALTSTPGSPELLLQGVLGIVLLALVAAAATFGDVAVLGIGAWSWLMLGTYGAALWLVKASHGRQSWSPSGRLAPHAADEPPPAPRRQSAARLTAETALLALAICGAGFALGRSGDAIAEQTGLGAGIVGALFLACATTLPELSTVLGAVRLRRYEMAIGDIFGTNLFNVTLIVLVDALHAGEPVMAEAGRFAAFASLLALVLTSIVVIGMIERRDRTFLRMGYDSLLVIACYAGGLALLLQLR
jgi:cation:H+ antiporter